MGGEEYYGSTRPCNSQDVLPLSFEMAQACEDLGTGKAEHVRTLVFVRTWALSTRVCEDICERGPQGL